MTTCALPREAARNRAYRVSGAASARSTATEPAGSNRSVAAASRSRSLPSGTTSSAPRPPDSAAWASSASRVGQSSAGSAVHTARAGRPSATAVSSEAPVG
jgi:hypothetical protein